MFSNLPVAQHLAVGDAVERDAAGEAQVLLAGLLGETARQAQHHLLDHRLDRRGEVHVALLEQHLRLARRAAEQRVEALVRHRKPGAVIEVVEIEPERAVGLEIDQVVEDQLCVFRACHRAQAPSPCTRRN